MEEQMNNTILFPYDFSPESDSAIDYLIELAKLFGYSIEILNIWDSGTKKYIKEHNLTRAALEEKISKMAENFHEKHGIETKYLLKNIPIKRIRRLSMKEQVTFTFLAIKKPQKMSTPIMKVVTTSPVPVLVVQQDVKFKVFKNILFPLDDTINSRQKASWALRFARKTDATIHIYTINPAALKSKELEYKQYRIIESCERFFTRNNIKFTTETSHGNYKDFTDEALKYAEKIGADFYIVMIQPPKLFQPVSPVDFKFIFNPHKTPVLCVNERDLFKGGGIT